jgi:hypothetical protein
MTEIYGEASQGSQGWNHTVEPKEEEERRRKNKEEEEEEKEEEEKEEEEGEKEGEEKTSLWPRKFIQRTQIFNLGRHIMTLLYKQFQTFQK